MKTFIVLAAVIAVAASGAVRTTGWGSPSTPLVDLELAAAAAAVGAGSADAGQSLTEVVSGNADAPASLASTNGVLAAVGQGEEIAQVAFVDLSNPHNPSASTVQAVDVVNEAVAIDSLAAAMEGANYAAVNNAAHTAASGEGAIAAEAISSNVVNGQGSGWKAV